MYYQIEVNVLIFMEMLFSFKSEQKIEIGNENAISEQKTNTKTT